MTNNVLHQLKLETIVDIRYVEANQTSIFPENADVHRKEHYLFVLVETRKLRFNIDYTNIAAHRGSLIYILAGQVHDNVHKAEFQYGFQMYP